MRLLRLVVLELQYGWNGLDMLGFVSFLLGMADRFRGGGWINTGSDFVCRGVWSVAFAMSFVLLHFTDYRHDLGSALLEVGLAIEFVGFMYLASTISHAFAQNSGTWSVMQCRWYTLWLLWLPVFPTSWRDNATLNTAGVYSGPWGGASTFQRKLFDFLQMAVVGAIRGAIAYTPYVVTTYLANKYFDVGPYSLLTPFAGIISTITISGLQGLSYLLGPYVPITITSSLKKFTATWSEFLNGTAWSVSLYLL